MQHGIQGFIDIWPKPTATAWKIIACFGAFEAVLQLFLPGKRVGGPISQEGNRPVYKANGFQAYAVTLITYISLWWFGIFNPTIVYDHLGEIFSALIFGSFMLCIFMYIKGHLTPSSTNSGSSGNAIIDFYWGMELYPRIGKHFDIKVFTSCRFGMMSWGVLPVTYCIKQYEENGHVADSMLVNTALMLIYVTKFFWWEAGYWNTMDIAHERADFYICWGCLVWVPSVYTSPGLYLVNRPVNLGTQLALLVLAAGILCIYINYDCDRTNGKCLVWGKAPSKIAASYQTGKGEIKTSLLLTSGWWGLARHFHYVPEIMSVFFWTIPALFNHRDDDRCRSKYGKYWELFNRLKESTGNERFMLLQKLNRAVRLVEWKKKYDPDNPANYGVIRLEQEVGPDDTVENAGFEKEKQFFQGSLEDNEYEEFNEKDKDDIFMENLNVIDKKLEEKLAELDQTFGKKGKVLEEEISDLAEEKNALTKKKRRLIYRKGYDVRTIDVNRTCKVTKGGQVIKYNFASLWKL